MHRAGEYDPSSRSLRLQPSSYVDAVSVNVVTVDDDVAEINADPEDNAFALRDIGIADGHGHLDLDGAPGGIDSAGKFQQQPVAHSLDDAPAMRGDCRVEQVGSVHPEARERAALVPPHQAGVADHIR